MTCTDGALSLGAESIDVALTKILLMDDWQFMYAGEPGNTDLVMENVRQQLLNDPQALQREKIQTTIRRAYKKRLAQWISDYVLAPYDMEMSEFKREGRQMFGDELARQLAKDMDSAAAQFKEEIMVVGWGSTPLSLMIYGVNQSGTWSGGLSGIGAIGSGGQVATSTLLLYGITRTSSLEDTLYAVAAAKFSAERCDGVGRDHTTIYVSRKRAKTDKPDEWVGKFLTVEEVDNLRYLWEDHGKPRIPDDDMNIMLGISQRVSGSVGAGSAVRFAKAVMQKSKRVKQGS
ncbi:MAG: hypothetical protein ACLPXM_04505 [Terriglobales bacterium]